MVRTLLIGALLLVSAGAHADEHVWPAGPRPPVRHPDLQPVRYGLAIDNPSAHTAAVTVTVRGYSKAPLDLALPVWAPGAYRLQVPARNVLQLRATGDDKPLRVEQLDRTTWRIHAPPRDGEVVVRYRVYHARASVVRSHVARDYAGINGFDTFLYVVGNLGTPCELTIAPHRGWQIASGMSQRGGALIARDYDVLIDSPVLMGTLRQRSFDVAGRPHHLVWSGDNDYDLDRLADDTRRIVEAVHPMFGGPLPYTSYWFLWRFDHGGGGGLEHLNSTRINDGPTGYRDPDELDRHWRVTSHEYVHTWNIKRIRPTGLGPFDYTKEQYTTYLWFGEGFTSYLGDLALLRAGIWSRDRYLRSLAQMIHQLRSAPAAEWMSAEQASFTTWHKADNGPRGRISFYNKGLLLALLLEMEIREGSGGKHELTDLTRRLNAQFRRDGKPFADGAIRRIAEELSGRDLSDFFARYVSGTERLPFEHALKPVGLTVAPKPGRVVATLGVTTTSGDQATVSEVKPRSPADVAGLRMGDIITGVEGTRVSGDGLGAHIRSLVPGRKVTLTVFRDDRVLRLQATLGERTVMEDPDERASFRHVPIRLTPREDATADQRRERDDWLRVVNPATPR